jgi:hypothetical protein
MDNNRLLSQTDLNPKQLKHSLKFLSDQGLIEGNPVDYDLETTRESHNPLSTEISLTEKGFDVAHERELTSNQQRTNMAVALLTSFLAIGSILQGYSAYLSHDALIDQATLAATLFIVVLFVLQIFIFILEESWVSFAKILWNGFRDSLT